VATSRYVPTKASTAVVDYVLEELFGGRLRSGDRLDLNEIGEALGISRLPVREAIVMLERDGIVATKYHRGVYVEPFDADSIIDDFEIMGLLSGVAVRRLAEKPDPATVATLEQLVTDLESIDPGDRQGVYKLVQEIMVLEHRAGGSRRLRAQLRSYAGFLPRAFDVISERSHDTTVKAHTRVVRAIAAGDGDKAARYRLEDLRDAGQDVVRELTRRGVIDPG
jgi:DNA-binding GntR family transcriptional regulator